MRQKRWMTIRSHESLDQKKEGKKQHTCPRKFIQNGKFDKRQSDPFQYPETFIRLMAKKTTL